MLAKSRVRASVTRHSSSCERTKKPEKKRKRCHGKRYQVGIKKCYEYYVFTRYAYQYVICIRVKKCMLLLYSPLGSCALSLR